MIWFYENPLGSPKNKPLKQIDGKALHGDCWPCCEDCGKYRGQFLFCARFAWASRHEKMRNQSSAIPCTYVFLLRLSANIAIWFFWHQLIMFGRCVGSKHKQIENTKVYKMRWGWTFVTVYRCSICVSIAIMILCLRRALLGEDASNMWVYNISVMSHEDIHWTPRNSGTCRKRLSNVNRKNWKPTYQRNNKSKASLLGLSCRLTDDDPGSAAEMESKRMKAQPGFSRLRTETWFNLQLWLLSSVY